MLCTGIRGDRLVGPARVPGGVKVTAVAFCNLLKEVLDPWLGDTLMSLLRNLVSMNDNTPHHTHTHTLLGPPKHPKGLTAHKVSPEHNPIKYLWSIIK